MLELSWKIFENCKRQQDLRSCFETLSSVHKHSSESKNVLHLAIPPIYIEDDTESMQVEVEKKSKGWKIK